MEWCLYWQYYDGSYWIIPSVNCTQGYPSKYSAIAEAVLIQSDHTIVINKSASGSVAITTQLMGTVTIWGTLTFNGYGNSMIDFILKHT